MQTSQEYNGLHNSINACGYTSLGSYYPNLPGTMQPVAPGRAMLSTNSYVVPQWKSIRSIGPDALSQPHGMNATCGGYFNVMAAYGKMPCNTEYGLSACSGADPAVPTGSP